MTPPRTSSRRPVRKDSGPASFKFQALAAEFEREIRALYKPGQRFESEPSICKRVGLNRETVHRAILQLEAQGLLRRAGRAGTFVEDFRQTGHDSRILGVAMAIRNHLWDHLFLALSNRSIEHDRYALICDFTGVGTSNPFAERLPLARMSERLSAALRLRPRTLVTDLNAGEDDALASLGSMQAFFHNLIVVNQARLHGFARCVSVRRDQMAGFALQGRSARRAGYEHLVLAVPPGNKNLAELQNCFAGPESGAFPMERQTVIFEHQPDRQARLIDLVRASTVPLAVVGDYDYGIHLVKETLQAAGLHDHRRVGLYGMNNTPWAVQDDLTSIDFDPDVWARMIFEAEDEFEMSGAAADRLVPPTLIERGSTRKAE